MNLSVNVAGVQFENPLIAASGTFGFGREYQEYYDISELGGVSTKGTTLLPREGNPTPRIAETTAGILNAVGLQNPGVEAFLKEDLAWLKSKTRAIANIAGSSVEDYEKMAATLNGLVDMVEMNISCPNVKEGGVAFGIYPDSIENITRKVKAQLPDTPLIVKLSPNVASIRDNARAAEQGGADVISLVNTFTGMAIDLKRRRPLLANVTGGLSGAAIKPIALRMVYEAAHAVKIPVIGMGGITTGTDVVEFLLAGAVAVQVGSANLYEPTAMLRIKKELIDYMQQNKIEDVNSLVNALNI